MTTVTQLTGTAENRRPQINKYRFEWTSNIDNGLVEMYQCRQLFDYAFDYASTLRFWRSREETYREEKIKWLNLNFRTAKPVHLESAVLKTAVPLDDEITGVIEIQNKDFGHIQNKSVAEIQSKGVTESLSSLMEDYTDAVSDKEFSDVDSELFVDPGDKRSTLDEAAWQRICAEIRAIHLRAETEFEERRKVFLHRLLFAAGFALLLLIGGIYLMWQAFLTPSPESTECTIRCYGGAETVVSEIMDTVFPKPNVNDEV